MDSRLEANALLYLGFRLLYYPDPSQSKAAVDVAFEEPKTPQLCVPHPPQLTRAASLLLLLTHLILSCR